MLTEQHAKALSTAIAESSTAPEARRAFVRTLLDYYRELLHRESKTIPTPRRWL